MAKCKLCLEEVPKWQQSKDYCSLRCEMEDVDTTPLPILNNDTPLGKE